MGRWGWGGSAIANAAAAIMSGMAECVVVFRALAQGEYGRFGQAAAGATVAGEAPTPCPMACSRRAHMFVMKYRRFMHEHGVEQDALRASRWRAMPTPRATRVP